MSLPLASRTSAPPTVAIAPPTAPDFHRKVYCLFGLALDAVTLSAAHNTLAVAIQRRHRCHLATPNSNILRLALQDEALRGALLRSDLCVTDGMPLVWLARLQGLPIPERVSGADLFEALEARHSNARSLSVYFFGGTEEVGQALQNFLRDKSRSIQCVGTASPPFANWAAMNSADVFSRINRAKPDLVAVSVGARAGLLWIDQNEKRVAAPVIANLGATINFAAHTVERAPVWLRRAGFEWLWRIVQEPKLWRRYGSDAASLAWVTLRFALPHLFFRALLWRPHTEYLKARIISDQCGKADRIALMGAWDEQNLSRLREVLTERTKTPRDLKIDLRFCSALDSAGLGILLLAWGHQTRMALRFELVNVPRALRILMRIQGCGFLLPRGL